jgi:hypothetical protein
MSSSFTALIDDLVAAQNSRDAAQAAGRCRAPAPVPRSARPIQALKPDPAFAKALADIADRSAANALDGLRLGSVVLCRGLAGPFRVIDLDAAAGRAKLRQARDTSNDPAGANFVEQETWAALADMSPAPGYEDSGAGSFADSLTLSRNLRASEAKIEGIRDRARALVSAKRRELSEALRKGEISGIAAAESEALLNQFCTRMGL